MNKSLARLGLVVLSCVLLMVLLAYLFNFVNAWVGIIATVLTVLIMLNSLQLIIDWMAKPAAEEPKPKKKTRKKPTK
jgi:hypothetical protein